MTRAALVAAVLAAAPAMASAVCRCGIAAERQNDFFWENEKFGMRAYGPGEDHRWSGFDVFNKMPDAASVGDLLRRRLPDVGNWHAKPQHGILDNYAVGAGRGCGGVAVYGDGEWKTYPNWESAEILMNTADMVSFRLTYPAFSAMGRMSCTITLKRGERFFKNTVEFERDCPEGFAAGPGLDLDPRRGHRGRVVADEEQGFVALFETARNPVEGSTATAILLDPADAAGCEIRTDHQNCRVLAVKRRSFTCYAGAAWSNAGEIVSADRWLREVGDFRRQIISTRK